MVSCFVACMLMEFMEMEENSSFYFFLIGFQKCRHPILLKVVFFLVGDSLKTLRLEYYSLLISRLGVF